MQVRLRTRASVTARVGLVGLCCWVQKRATYTTPLRPAQPARECWGTHYQGKSPRRQRGECPDSPGPRTCIRHCSTHGCLLACTSQSQAVTAYTATRWNLYPTVQCARWRRDGGAGASSPLASPCPPAVRPCSLKAAAPRERCRRSIARERRSGRSDRARQPVLLLECAHGHLDVARTKVLAVENKHALSVLIAAELDERDTDTRAVLCRDDDVLCADLHAPSAERLRPTGAERRDSMHACEGCILAG